MVSEPTHPMTQLSFIIDAPNLRPNHHHMGFISQEMDFSQWYKIQSKIWIFLVINLQMNEVIDQLTFHL